MPLIIFKKINFLLPQSPLTKAEEGMIVQKIEERKCMALGSIHLAAAVLDPSNQGDHLTADAMEFIYKVAENMNIDVSASSVASVKKDGLWCKKFVWLPVTLKLQSAYYPLPLAPLLERYFSTFSWIQNKKRNWLTNERAGVQACVQETEQAATTKPGPDPNSSTDGNFNTSKRSRENRVEIDDIINNSDNSEEIDEEESEFAR
ncbi:unnamed protein product [Brassicogethes aeneus]|uniref:Uncharacterized protein n=1 Tax=Brassicogethes aeneus TaxID=1431903 RepID=A0A9P0BHD6_BRAAE|nr:unnamed protein product [Brassicogethes aeneus]